MYALFIQCFCLTRYFNPEAFAHILFFTINKIPSYYKRKNINIHIYIFNYLEAFSVNIYSYHLLISVYTKFQIMIF